MDRPIYLDYNATTPIAPQVAKAMVPYLYNHFGNPSSSHPYGVTTKIAVEKARSQVSNLLGCQPHEIIFTSGGTESNNFAIRGIANTLEPDGNHIITSSVEHPTVSEVCRWLSTQGFEITVLPVDGCGLVDPSDLEQAIKEETILISVMHANNEVGTIQPIKTLTQIAHNKGVLFHTDAAQTVGKIPVNVKDLGIDLLSVAGHKLYAPKGVGALFIREGLELTQLMYGAGHESGRRPGTENVLEIVGLGKACEIASQDLDRIQILFKELRDRLHKGIETALGTDYVRLNGHPTRRLPNTLNLSFRDVAANAILTDINDKVAASAGSACHANQVDVSTVLVAMKIPLDWAMGTMRLSVGRFTREEEIDLAVQVISGAVQNRMSPIY